MEDVLIDNDLLMQTIKNLKRNRISSVVFQTAAELLYFFDGEIKDSSIVGVGDSETLHSMNIYQYLRNRKIHFLDKYVSSLKKDEKRQIYLRNFAADYFLCSANAISAEGKIYNLDGNGSRVASVIYGPRKVFIIAGVNKIVANEEEAIKRIKNIAAPIDAKRLNKKTPCVFTGKCENCSSPDKICNYMTIVQGQFDADRIKVIFINEKLGF